MLGAGMTFVHAFDFCDGRRSEVKVEKLLTRPAFHRLRDSGSTRALLENPAAKLQARQGGCGKCATRFRNCAKRPARDPVAAIG